MDNIRRAIATFSIVAILSSFVVSTAFAGTFTDVKEGTYYYDAVEALVEAGTIPGTVETYNPGGGLTRALAAKYVVEGAGWEVTTHDTATFKDVPKTHSEFDLIETAVDHEFMKGSGAKPGYFLPTDTVNRAEYAKMAVLSFELETYEPETPTFTDVKTGDWFYDYVETAAYYGVVNGKTLTTFAPAEAINRADGATMTVRAQTAEAPAEGEGEGEGEGEEVEGDLEVAVSDDTPETATLPSGATSVTMASWDFTSGDADATIDSLVITRFGVSTLPTSHAVYLYEGSNRLTAGKSVNSSTNLATFTNLNFEVPAGETKTISLRMDVGTVSATGEIGFELAAVDDVDAGEGEVTGDFPLQGEKFGLSTTAAGIITIEKNGTVTNPKVGQKDVTVAKFKIGAATEDALLQELGVYFGGTVTTTDVIDLKLYVSGTTEPLAEVDLLNSKDIAQFVIDEGYEIAKGDTRNFTVSASFNTGRSNDTVHAYIDESTDVLAIGSKYGYGMGVTMTAYDGNADACASASSADCTYSALEGGDVTISGTAISNRNLAINQDDVSVLNFTIAAATDVTFDNFVLMMDTGTTAETASDDAGLWDDDDNAPNFTDIKVKEVGGDAIWGPVDSDELDSDLAGTNIVDGAAADSLLSDTAQAYYLFTDDLVMDAGDTMSFEVTLDVANNSALSNETLVAGIYVNATYPTLKDVNNKTLTNSSSLVPTSSYTGDTFTVKTNSLTVAKSSAVGSATKVIGTEGVQMLALSIGAGDASSTKITSLSLKGYVDSDAAANAGAFVAAVETKYFNEMVLGMNLYKGTVSEANKINTTAKSANTSGVVTFDNLSWTIAAGQTETLIVTGNLANDANYNNYAVKIDVDDVSADVIAEDNKGNSVSSSSTDDPNGSTTDSTSYVHIMISSGGTLTVDIPSNTPSARVAVAGTTGNELAKIKYTAARESFKLEKLSLRNNYVTSVGDYDDNFSALKVKYFTDAAQTVEATTSCAAAAEEGYFTCSGMNMYVPDADLSATPDYAILTVLADLADVASDQADEGDLPEVTLSLAYDFEATGIGSSTKITENGATNSLAITDSVVASYATASDAVGADLDATGADTVLNVTADDSYHAGDLICIDDADTGCDATDEIAYVVAKCTAVDVPHADCTADNDLVLVRGVNGEITYAATTASDDIDLLVYTSVLDVNLVEVRATNMALTAASSRSGSTAATEAIMSITATANVAKDVLIRQGLRYAVDADAANWTASASVDTEDTSVYVSGTSSEKITVTNLATNELWYKTVTATDMSTYDSVGFWVRSSLAIDGSTNVLAFQTDETAALASAEFTSTIGALSANYWTYVVLDTSGTTDTSKDAVLSFGIKCTTGDGALDPVIYIDEITFFSEKINVDLTLNENWAAVTPTVAYLKQNGTTVATAYVDFDGVTTSKSGQITFVPVGTYANIEINGADTFTVEMDTATAITDDSSATEKLTAKVDLGAYGTAGDVYWYDGSNNPTTTYISTKYLGTSSTENISTVTSY